VLGGLVAVGAAAVGISSQGGQLLAFLAAILALVALTLGFIGFTVARLAGTSRLPGIAAMALAVAVIAGLIVIAVS
jgi:VIT1/CCC1 family predicted Fe2+/Mn2+ transporter